MNIQKFLESSRINDITIRGEYYTLVRSGDNNWLVYSHTSLSLPLSEHVLFADAAEVFAKMEDEQREFHKHDNAW
mgnify:CR=1 FL=1